MGTGLTESDRALACDLAKDPLFLAGLARLGPVPRDVLALCEAYVGFLRYAPSLNPPPALWAAAIVHRYTSDLYDRFWIDAPDLADRLRSACDQPGPFFADDYILVRRECLDKMDFIDEAIWPINVETMNRSSPVFWAAMAAIVFVISLAIFPMALTSVLMVCPAIGISGALMSGATRDMQRYWFNAKPTTVPRTPDVMRKSLINIKNIRCSKTMADRHETGEDFKEFLGFLEALFVLGPLGLALAELISFAIAIAISLTIIIFNKYMKIRKKYPESSP